LIKKSLLLALQIAAHLAYMVVIPLFILGGIGLLVDRHYQTTPLYLFVGIILSMIATFYWISKRLRQVIKLS
jgi:F0F1-type ATP synthase assembly protein I